ncbi:MAG: hypothetical protein M3O34_09005 [Chloroflexota bacterium]|nr:hypothetical protein [Chloroflexota bacterium]
MARLPAEIPFDRWLDYLFGCPVGPSGFRESDDWWDEQADPALAVAFLTRFFEAPEIALARYPHDQIDRGLWFLAGESGHLSPLLGPPVPWDARRRGLLAIGGLYERLFAPVCANHLGHLDRGPEPPNLLNSICYMWWDLFPTWGGHGGEQPRRAAAWGQSRRARRRLRTERRADADAAEASLLGVDETILYVMARTLRLESEPCREGALHGLGHWRRAYPERTAAIIDEWLDGEPRISPELRRYAMAARSGCVL